MQPGILFLSWKFVLKVKKSKSSGRFSFRVTKTKMFFYPVKPSRRNLFDEFLKLNLMLPDCENIWLVNRMVNRSGCNAVI